MRLMMVNSDREAPARRSGIFNLWLKVLDLSLCELQKGRGSTQGAEEFLFDESNIFFDFVADEMGYEPVSMRLRLKRVLSVT